MYQVPELGDEVGDRAVEPVAGKVQELEGGKGDEGRDEVADEEVSGEGECAEQAHACDWEKKKVLPHQPYFPKLVIKIRNNFFKNLII